MKYGRWWAWLWLGLGLIYFFVPLFATLQFSLRAQKDVLSLLAYQRVVQDDKFWANFGFSLQMAVITIILGLLLVVPTAYWVRLKLPQLRPLVEFVTLFPFVIPAIVLVFGLVRVYSGAPFYLTNTHLGSQVLLVAGYLVLALPYLYRAVDAGLQAMDMRALTEAAQSLGASWPTILFRVIFPNLTTAMLSGAFLTLATVVGEFTLTTFIVSRGFGPYMVDVNRAYESAALAILSFSLTWLAMGAIQWLGRGAASAAGAR